MGETRYKLTVVGAGYVGLTSAVLFAGSGYDVTLLEIDKKRLASIRAGKSFFYEEGIDELLREALDKNYLKPADDAKQALSNADIIFSCVGTPDNPDGSSNLSYVFGVAEQAVKHAKGGAVFVQKSTVPVGTGEKIEELFNDGKKNFAYVSNPEFLREGTAIKDSLYFDRVVVGSNNNSASNKVLSIYRTIEDKRDELLKTAKLQTDLAPSGQYIETDRNSAELTKVTANAFLALKISFANSIAKLADEAKANVSDVMDAVGADRRIGRAFLNAGRGYGGGCFPKDVSGLISSAAEFGVDMPIMTAATDVNESMPGYIAHKAQEILGTLENKRVAVLGLSFKSGTSDARKSPGVKLANLLAKAGATVVVYDPHVNGEAKEELKKNILVHGNALEAVKNSDAVFIATAWQEFSELNPSDIKSYMKGSLVYDTDNALSRDKVTAAGLKYIAVGMSI